MVAFKSTRIRRKDPLKVGVPLSLALHGLLLTIILSANAPHPPQATVIDVTLEAPNFAKNPQKQIVSPPLEKASVPPPETNKLSDVDSTAVREQIQRGNNGGQPGSPSKAATNPQSQQQPSSPKPPPPPPHEPIPQPQKQAKDPQKSKPSEEPATGDHHLKSLKLDDATLAMKFGTSPSKQKAASSSASRNSSLSEYQAFSRPPGSGAAFLGTAGISDHLPNLPDGDITMLNAKANTYASFVRRVAIQVFTQLRSQGWEHLSRQQIQQLSDFTTIEAVISREGKLMGVKIHESSGSPDFDSVVKLSVSAGAQDPNPPPGAEAQDGFIHFIFKARSWSQMGVNPRSGIASEHRWLLLATGLE